jgi:cysteine-rich repeat protein
MNGMKKNLLVSLLTSLAVVAVGCGEPETEGILLPPELQQLSPEQADRLQAFLTIEGVINDAPMEISSDLREAILNVVIDDAVEVTGAAVKFELFMEDDPDLGAQRQPPILLGRATSTIDIKPGQPNSPEQFSAFDDCGVAIDESFPCSVELNQNRNDKSNLKDLAEGIDAFQRDSFIDIAPDTLQFASGVQLGEFAQQVILIENGSADEVTLEARLVGAPGVTIEPIEANEDIVGDGRSIALGELNEDEEIVVPPFAEVFLAVSFAPVNQFLTTGVVQVTSTNQRTKVRTSRAIKIIANADGALRPAPPELNVVVDNPISVTAELGGFPADQVQTYDPERLASGLQVQAVQQNGNEVSGLPFTGNTIEVDFGEDNGPAVFPADAAFLMSVPTKNRLSVSLAGLESDVDLTIFELDGNDNIISDRARVKRNSSGGSDEEAVELRNSGDADRRFLMVLGRIDPEVTDRAEVRGNIVQQAADITEPVSFSVNAQSSATPEFTAPPIPDTGPLEGGNRALLRGIGFDGRAKVFFAGRQALDCEFSTETVNDLDQDGVLDEETLFDCTVPPGSLEAGANPATIVVANPAPEEGGDGQAATRKQAYTYEPPAPRLDSVTPDLASTDGAEGIVIRGAFFSARNADPVVKFGNTRASTVQFVDSTRMVVSAPPQAAGVVSITVQNVLNPPEEIEERLSLPSNSRNFRYVVPVGPAPTVTAVDPASVSVDGGATVTITGTGFVDGAEVNIDGVDAIGVVVNGATSITTVAPARDLPGAVDVRVINPDGQSGALEGGLSYFIPAPGLDSLIPAQGTTTGGTVTVVKGTGFRAGIQVDFIDSAGGEFASPNVNRVSSSTLIVSSPSVTTGGLYDLRITNIDGQTATLDDAFTYITPDQPPPVINTISPSTGTESGGDVITITGTDFRGASGPQILFGVNEVPPPAVTEFSVDGVDDFITFVTPAGAPGPVIVRLINGDGQADSTFFTYVNDNGPPNITAMIPDEGLKGTAVSLLGSNFDIDGNGALAAGASLTVGTLPAVITNATISQIDFVVPDLDAVIPVGVASAQMTVEMSNADGQSATASFRYQKEEDAPPPQITNINPAAAQVGDRVTITGNGFNATLLQVGDVAIAAGSLVTNTATSISFDVPAVSTVPGVVNVRVVNVDGQQDTSVLSITLGPPPVIESITPNEVPLTGGGVALTGTGFDPGATVTVGGASATANVGPTDITFTAPAQGFATTVTVRVTNPDGQSDTTALSYKAPDVAGGDPEVSVVIPETFHAIVPGDELILVGENFPTIESAFLSSTGNPQSASTLTIVSQSSTSVRVRVDQGVPDSIVDASLYAVNLVHANGSVVSPLLEARGPRTFLAETSLLLGEFYNPDNLTAVTLVNQQFSFSVSLPIINKSETIVTLDDNVNFDPPPGLPLIISLDYDDPINGGTITGVNADPDNQVPPVGRESIRLDMQGFMPASTDLGGLSFDWFADFFIDDPSFGTLGGFRLVDAAGTVFGGGQVEVFEGQFGRITFDADFDGDQTNDQAPPGDYFIEFFTDVTPALASNREGQPFVSSNLRVARVNPDPAEAGRGFQLQGFFFFDSEIVAENVADAGDVVVLNNFSFDNGDEFKFIEGNHPLQLGTYRLCVFPGGTGAAACPVGPDTFDLDIVPPRACGGAGDVGGPGEGEGEGEGQGDRFFFGGTFTTANTVGTVDDNNACGPTTGATGFETTISGLNFDPGGTMEIVLGAGAPAGLQLVIAEEFQDACGGDGTCVGAVPVGPFAIPAGNDFRRLLFIDPAGGASTFEIGVYVYDSGGQCINGFLDFDNDNFNDCDEDCGLLDPTINPNATEVCGDSLDNNCFGGVDEGCNQTPFDFSMGAMTANACTIVEHGPQSGPDRGGIAVGAGDIYYNGGASGVVVDLELVTPAAVARRDTFFSDLATGDLFAFTDGAGTLFDVNVDPGPWTFEQLQPLDVNLDPVGAPVALTEPIIVQETQQFSNNAIFAGKGEVGFYNQNEGAFYFVELATGEVTRPAVNAFNQPWAPCNNFAAWGIAERFGDEHAILFASNDGQRLQRINVTTRVVTDVTLFPQGTNGLCSMTAVESLSRWYFHYQGFSDTFGGGSDQSLGFCDAAVCGDTNCDIANGENAFNCAADCAASCGNGVCETPFEDDVNCAADCAPTCGNLVCEETFTTCPQDCPASFNPGFCGDGACFYDERLNCAQDCAQAAVCNNGVIEAAETCEDGNTTPGDGCDENCNIEAVDEVEPNDDGNVQEFDPDFDPVNAQPFADVSFAVRGSISPSGDNDWYAFTNNTGAPIALDLFVTSDPPGGQCPGDPEMLIFDDQGSQLNRNDDFFDLCPGIENQNVQPGETVFIGIQDLSDNGDTFGPYRLTATTKPGQFGFGPCVGSFTIANDQDRFILENCTQIDGDLTVTAGFNGFLSMSNLNDITGSLIVQNSGVNGFGLDFLNSIGGDFVLDGNANLFDLFGLGNLSNIGGSFVLNNNASFQAFDGLGLVPNIPGDFIVVAQGGLFDFFGLSVSSVGGNVQISSNGNLNNVNGFSLTDVTGSFEISNNPNLSNFDQLSGGLVNVGVSVLVQDNSLLGSVSGLSGLSSVGGSLSIINNDNLPDLTGLDNIDNVGANLVIDDNDFLGSIAALQGLSVDATIGGLQLFGGIGAGVAMASDGTAYVAQNNAIPATVVEILPPYVGINRTVYTAPAQHQVGDLELDPAETSLYVAGADNFGTPNPNVTKVDLGLLTTTDISVPGTPIGIAVDTAGDLFVSESGTGNIERFDSAGTPLGTFATGTAGTLDIEFGPDGFLYEGGQASPTVVRYDGAGNPSPFIDLSATCPSVPLHSLMFDGDGDLWVTCYNDAKIVEVTPGLFVRDVLVPGGDLVNGLGVDGAGNIYTLMNGAFGGQAQSPFVRFNGAANGPQIGLDIDGDVPGTVNINNNINLDQLEAEDLGTRVNRACNPPAGGNSCIGNSGGA